MLGVINQNSDPHKLDCAERKLHKNKREKRKLLLIYLLKFSFLHTASSSHSSCDYLISVIATQYWELLAKEKFREI